MAAANGTWRGRRAVVPPPANRPRLGSSTPKVARVDATLMSTPPSISIPPATHGPSMAAMTGLYRSTLRRTASVPSERRHPSISVTSPEAIFWESSVICGM